MKSTRNSLLKGSCIAALLIGILALQAKNQIAAHAHAFSGTVDTHQCTVSTPAISSFGGSLVLVWVGCDSQHHMNIEFSKDGSTWNNKITLDDTALPGAGPAVTNFNNKLYIVWAGTDSPTHLHIGYFQNSPALGNHARIEDSTYHTPAITTYLGLLYLTFTGTDGHLNFEDSSDGIHFGDKVVGNDTAVKGPSTTYFNHQLYVSWVGTDVFRTLNVAYYAFGPTLNNHSEFPGENAGSGDQSLTAFSGSLYVADVNDGGNAISLRMSSDAHTWSPPAPICFSPDIACTSTGVSMIGYNNHLWSAWQNLGTSSTIYVQQTQ